MAAPPTAVFTATPGLSVSPALAALAPALSLLSPQQPAASAPPPAPPAASTPLVVDAATQQAAQEAVRRMNALLTGGGGADGSASGIFAEVDINHSTKKGLLTKKATQEQIGKETGASVLVRGRYKPPGDTSNDERALHLHVQAETQATLQPAPPAPRFPRAPPSCPRGPVAPRGRAPHTSRFGSPPTHPPTHPHTQPPNHPTTHHPRTREPTLFLHRAHAEPHVLMPLGVSRQSRRNDTRADGRPTTSPRLRARERRRACPASGWACAGWVDVLHASSPGARQTRVAEGQSRSWPGLCRGGLGSRTRVRQRCRVLSDPIPSHLHTISLTFSHHPIPSRPGLPPLILSRPHPTPPRPISSYPTPSSLIPPHPIPSRILFHLVHSFPV